MQTLSRQNRICSGKHDTFVLDFVNEAKDVQDDFQVFYHETNLEDEVNTDLLYKVQRELRAFGIYDDSDIAAVCNVYFFSGAQGSDVQGKLKHLTKTSRPLSFLPNVSRPTPKRPNNAATPSKMSPAFLEIRNPVSTPGIPTMMDSIPHIETTPSVFCGL